MGTAVFHGYRVYARAESIHQKFEESRQNNAILDKMTKEKAFVWQIRNTGNYVFNSYTVPYVFRKKFDSSENGKGKVISTIVAEDVMLREERSFTNGRSEVIYIIKYMKHFHEITV